MDPLSDILALLKPNSYAFRGLDAGGDWAIGFEAADGMNCYAIQSGACWVAVDGVAEPTRLFAGDVILLPSRSAFRLYSAADAPVMDVYELISAVAFGETAVVNGGGGCSGVGGYFDFQGLHAELLLGVLPPIVHIRAEETRAALGWLISRLMSELREPQMGGALIAGHLAQTLLIEALRLHMAERSLRNTGWLFALAEPPMRAVIAAMHAEPGRRWTLRDLAHVAGMSRSSFAARFKEAVGEPAMEYLTRWRMMVAADRLAQEGAMIAAVAPSVGYDSDSAFGAAFKRVIGQSPRQFVIAMAHRER